MVLTKWTCSLDNFIVPFCLLRFNKTLTIVCWGWGSFFDQFFSLWRGGGGTTWQSLQLEQFVSRQVTDNACFYNAFPRSLQNMFLHNMICNSGHTKQRTLFFYSTRCSQVENDFFFSIPFLREKIRNTFTHPFFLIILR